MGLFQVVLSQLISIILFGVLGLGVAKAFQIANELSEIKDLLRDIKRNTNNYAPAPSSPANLARAVDAEGHQALIDQALREQAFPD